MRVLAVGAHPDDLEVLAGGTLARYASEGHEVVMSHVANGDLGSFDHQRAELAAMRTAEARAASRLAGADYLCVGVPDGEVSAASLEQRRMVVELVREAAPDVILTHPPNDYHSDHNETSKLVFDASFLATVPLLEAKHAYLRTIPPIVYMDTVAGLNFEPTEFVDISEWIDTKVSMLAEHRSQLRWLQQHAAVDMLDDIRSVARFRGIQCGVNYAEAFRMCNVFLRATTRRLLP